MSNNPIQFQPGMSLPEFLRCFGTEAACSTAVHSARWPDGFYCPLCSGRACCRAGVEHWRRFHCAASHSEVSSTASTRGGGSQNTVPFVVTILFNDQGNPFCIQPAPVPGSTSPARSWWSESNLAPSTRVLTDGLGCFAAVV